MSRYKQNFINERVFNYLLSYHSLSLYVDKAASSTNLLTTKSGIRPPGLIEINFKLIKKINKFILIYE